MAFPGLCPDMARRSLPTLSKWAVLLGGPLIWSAHLGFVYAVTTVAITLTGGGTRLACPDRPRDLGLSRRDGLDRMEPLGGAPAALGDAAEGPHRPLAQGRRAALPALVPGRAVAGAAGDPHSPAAG